MPASPKSILEAYRMCLDGNTSWEVYQVGCTFTPLNFASQQRRAFTLMWAIDMRDEDREFRRDSDKPANWLNDKRVGIIGGGFAGVTAGICAILRGAKKVEIYERAHELIPLQHGSTRDIRPFIYRWPGNCDDSDSPDILKNHFPVLRWKSGPANDVRRQVLQDAERIYNNRAKHGGAKTDGITSSEPARRDSSNHNFYRQILGTEVRSVAPVPGSTEIRVMAEGNEPSFVRERNEFLPVGQIRNFVEHYDVVIAAVGFGLERTTKSVPYRSYWHTDSLAQPIFTGRTPWRIVISGTGDGGLTDAIRARLFDIDLTEAIDLLCGKPPKDLDDILQRDDELQKIGFSSGQWEVACSELRRELLKIEDEAKNHKPGGDAESVCETCGATKVNPDAERMANDAFGEFLQDKYVALTRTKSAHRHTMRALSAYFRARERTDTIVYLIGQASTPYTPNASPLFRFVVFLLKRYCGLRFLSGRPKFPDDPQVPNQPVVLEVELRDKSNERLIVDDVYVRHGAEPAWTKLFANSVKRVSPARKNGEQLVAEKLLWVESGDTIEKWNVPHETWKEWANWESTWQKWKNDLSALNVPASLSTTHVTQENDKTKKSNS